MTDKTSGLASHLTIGIARVAERAALAAAKLIGRGDEKAADQAAVDAMREALNRLDISGRIVIGEGERDAAPMLYIGEQVGTGNGPEIDIALDPLEGTTLTAKGQANALAVIAFAARGKLLYAPDTYMQKIAIAGGYEPGLIDLDATVSGNVQALAQAKGVEPDEITACVLDRPRHDEIIAELRALGVRINLIGDGDVAGVISTTNPNTGIDIYLGTGGAPEGVLAAVALRCSGGQMQGRLVTDNPEQKARAKEMGIEDFDRKLDIEDMARGDVLFAATGVTSGTLLGGVCFDGDHVITETMVMSSAAPSIRWIRTRHAAGTV